MMFFIRTHLPDDGAGARILLRQELQMLVQMFDHLALGLRDKAEAGPISRQSRERTDSERSRIPERIQHTGAAAQFLDPAGAPGEMVGFLLSSLLQRVPR